MMGQDAVSRLFVEGRAEEFPVSVGVNRGLNADGKRDRDHRSRLRIAIPHLSLLKDNLNIVIVTTTS